MGKRSISEVGDGNLQTSAFINVSVVNMTCTSCVHTANDFNIKNQCGNFMLAT